MHSGPIAEDRDLTAAEGRLLRWLLDHGKPEARDFIAQIDGLRVASRCPCGCPSINFNRAESKTSAPPGMHVLSHYVYEDEDGHTIGVFAFAQGDALAGIEVWSIAGDPIPERVPDPSVLRPFPHARRPTSGCS